MAFWKWRDKEGFIPDCLLCVFGVPDNERFIAAFAVVAATKKSRGV